MHLAYWNHEEFYQSGNVLKEHESLVLNLTPKVLCIVIIIRAYVIIFLFEMFSL